MGLLDDRNAIVYGGAGLVGGAIARGFAAEGARVHLAGRTAETLERKAAEIEAEGGRAETIVLDAYDAEAVDSHAGEVAERFGSIDVSVNVVNHGDVQGKPMTEMEVADYLAPVANGVTTSFITWTAAARRMAKQAGGGVIIAFGGTAEPARGHHIGGLQVGLHAIEAMRGQFAVENGADGVRVCTIKTGGIGESIPEDFEGRDELIESLVEPTMLGRLATAGDIADAAVFLASDRARSITGATVNVSAGAIPDA